MKRRTYIYTPEKRDDFGEGVEKKNRKILEGYLTNKNKREDSMRALSHMLTRNSKGYSSDMDEDILNDIIRRNK